jgi:ERCC4-type nuclease
MAKKYSPRRRAAAKPEISFPIYEDSREQQGWTFSKSKIITDIEQRKLFVGDYTIQGLEDRFTIERKGTTSEIANNFTEKRWPDFLERMQSLKYRFIVCEFDLATVLDFPYGSGIPARKMEYIRITPSFLMSCIYKIEVDLKIPFIFAGSRAGAEAVAENLMKRVYRLEK